MFITAKIALVIISQSAVVVFRAQIHCCPAQTIKINRCVTDYWKTKSKKTKNKTKQDETKQKKNKQKTKKLIAGVPVEVLFHLKTYTADLALRPSAGTLKNNMAKSKDNMEESKFLNSPKVELIEFFRPYKNEVNLYVTNISRRLEKEMVQVRFNSTMICSPI